MAKSYAKEGANTGKKCIGRILVRGSLWALAGLALTSAVVLIKNTYKIDVPLLNLVSNK